MSGPARVRNAALPGQGIAFEKRLEIPHLALGAQAFQGPVLLQSNAGRVVAPVFEGTKAGHQDLADVTVGGCSYYSTHLRSLSWLLSPARAGENRLPSTAELGRRSDRARFASATNRFGRSLASLLSPARPGKNQLRAPQQCGRPLAGDRLHDPIRPLRRAYRLASFTAVISYSSTFAGASSHGWWSGARGSPSGLREVHPWRLSNLRQSSRRARP